MVTLLLMGYLSGWVAVTFAAYAAGRHLTDRQLPASHQLMVSVAAGAIWPLLVVGLVELSSIMVFAKVQSKASSRGGILT
jgi:hypothetical protein